MGKGHIKKTLITLCLATVECASASAQSSKLGDMNDVRTVGLTESVLCAREIRSLTTDVKTLQMKPVAVNPPGDAFDGRVEVDVVGYFPVAAPIPVPGVPLKVRISCRLVYVDAPSLRMKVDGIEIRAQD